MMQSKGLRLPPASAWWQRLPRDGRDSLLVLLAVALVLLPQMAFLPPWASALSATLLLWRAVLAWHSHPLPGRWWRVGLLALVVGGVALQFRSIVGPDAGVVLLALLLMLKTLEMRARRDAMVIFFLGFFSLVTVFVQSQSLLTALAVLLALWMLLAALLNAHLPGQSLDLPALLRQAGGMLLWGLPLMVLLFVFFPRLPPLWGLPTDSLQGRTGLSENMQVGTIASLAQDSSVALRVRFGAEAIDTASASSSPPQHLLYFRGPVLSQFDGRNWSAHSPHWPPHEPAQAVSTAAALEYEVTLEPHRQRWLLTLEATSTAPALAQRKVLGGPQLQWFSPQPITEVLRYRAQALLQYQYGQTLGPGLLKPLLRLPEGFDPRTRAWAQQLRQQHGNDDAAIVQAAIAHLRSGGYTYTLEPGSYPQHTADTFWFDRKEGFCEHIASAFAVLMRAAGIPARIVTGYQGGEKNPVDGLWTVRQSDAHAWAEVWLPAQGWVRVDPTTAVAPARTEQLQRLAPAGGLLGQAVGRFTANAWMLHLRSNWEAINHRWNTWVLNYNSDKQSQLFSDWGLSDLSPGRLGLGLLGLLVGALAVVAAWLRYQQRQRDPWLHWLERLRRKLERAGLALPPSASPRQMAQAVQAHWGQAQPQQAQALHSYLLGLEQWRYAPARQPRPSLRQLRQQLPALPRPLPPHTAPSRPPLANP